MLATNDLFSVGGGFVVNGALSTAATAAAEREAAETALVDNSDPLSGSGHHPPDLAENMYYKEIRRADAAEGRRTGSEVKPHNDSDAEKSLVLPDGGSTDPGAALTAADPSAIAVASDVASDEAGHRQPRYPFRDANSLLALCRKHNLTIAQIVYENEKGHGYTDDEIFEKLFRIWEVMDNSILEGVQAPIDSTLPGSLKLHRRAPGLYKRLARGLYGGQLAPGSPKSEESSTGANPSTSPKTSTSPVRKSLPGQRRPLRILSSLDHPIVPSHLRRTTFPAMDHLSVYAMAVNETNAAGGRVVTAPTNGAAGIIPAVLKYVIEFASDDAERDFPTFLLTAAAIGMLQRKNR